MTITTEFYFDMTHKQGRIIYKINSTEEITHSYNFAGPSLVVLCGSMINTISYDDLIQGKIITQQWLNFISRNFAPLISEISQFDLELKKNQTVMIKLEIEGEMLIDAIWDDHTDQITFQAVGENIISWSDYRYYLNRLELFIKLIAECRRS